MPKNLAKSIRGDKLRQLHDAAVSQGFTSKIDGGGHILIVGPDGRRFSISGSVRNSFGRNYENVKARARRAGLDVTNL